MALPPRAQAATWAWAEISPLRLGLKWSSWSWPLITIRRLSVLLGRIKDLSRLMPKNPRAFLHLRFSLSAPMSAAAAGSGEWWRRRNGSGSLSISSFLVRSPRRASGGSLLICAAARPLTGARRAAKSARNSVEQPGGGAFLLPR
jgi:hypothetical protein